MLGRAQHNPWRPATSWVAIGPDRHWEGKLLVFLPPKRRLLTR